MIIKQPQLMQFMQLCFQLWVIRTVCLYVMPQHLSIEQSCGIIISCDDINTFISTGGGAVGDAQTCYLNMFWRET
jgi:hypothetical protein